jgi:hypothetical protein
MRWGILFHVEPFTGRHNTDKPMKNDIITLAVVLGTLVAGTAFLLSSDSPVSAETLVGYGSVIALLAVAALDYRLTWK